MPLVAKLANQAAPAPAQSPIASAPRPPAPATVAALAPMKPAAVSSVAPLAEPSATRPQGAPKQPHVASLAPALSQAMPSIKVAPARKPALKPEPAAPGAESSSDKDAKKEPSQPNRTDTELTRVQGELLEASIESELAQVGYASLGVSVNDEGDVFLAGTFLSQADEDQVLAMIRHIQHVRDIYFSGSVWHSERASEPSPEAPSENAPSQARAPLVKSAASMPEQEPDEFPVTAADVPALSTRRSASPAENPTNAPALAPR
jgi:hypothetical protein